jgi:hypothetical protein
VGGEIGQMSIGLVVGTCTCRIIDEGAVYILLCCDTGNQLTRENTQSIEERVHPSSVLDDMHNPQWLCQNSGPKLWVVLTWGHSTKYLQWRQ